MKKVHLNANVPAEVRGIDQKAALNILHAIHHYALTCAGRVKPLKGEFEGLFRLRVGNYRVLFEETEDSVVIHGVMDRRNAYR